MSSAKDTDFEAVIEQTVQDSYDCPAKVAKISPQPYEQSGTYDVEIGLLDDGKQSRAFRRVEVSQDSGAWIARLL